ncbi:MAG: TatD family hydrolase [Paludibacter sp.]|nr:TatD family hydrolase [Paludibacter sp.]
MIDTHSHIYSEEFDNDRDEVILRAKNVGVEHIILPNIDSESLPRMLQLEAEYPDFCHAAIGLHPTSVNQSYKSELNIIKSELERKSYIAIGEIGIDLYWDKTFLKEQIETFQLQLTWAVEYNLPVIIHIRDAFRETMKVMELFRNKGLSGVFHSFGGDEKEAAEIMNFGGFYLGINGIVTFKNSNLRNVLKSVPLEYILTETDAPYLTPVPFRGKRNESAYIDYVCDELAKIYNVDKSLILRQSTENSRQLFKKLGN